MSCYTLISHCLKTLRALTTLTRSFLPVDSYTLPIIIIVYMDRASEVLVQGLPLDISKIWAALSKQGDTPLTTLYYRVYRRPSVRLRL